MSSSQMLQDYIQQCLGLLELTITMGDKRKHGVLGSTNKQSNMSLIPWTVSCFPSSISVFLSNFLKCSFVSSLCLAWLYNYLINYMLLICNFFLSHFLSYMWYTKTHIHTWAPFVMLALSKFVKYLFLNPTTVDFSESSLNLLLWFCSINMEIHMAKYPLLILKF